MAFFLGKKFTTVCKSSNSRKTADLQLQVGLTTLKLLATPLHEDWGIKIS